jgi:hypothetical protein
MRNDQHSLISEHFADYQKDIGQDSRGYTSRRRHKASA